jgi:hypothetical protein
MTANSEARDINRGSDQAPACRPAAVAAKERTSASEPAAARCGLHQRAEQRTETESCQMSQTPCCSQSLMAWQEQEDADATEMPW